jgi:hypothetical protein
MRISTKFDIRVTYKWLPPADPKPVKSLGTSGNGQTITLIYLPYRPADPTTGR